MTMNNIMTGAGTGAMTGGAIVPGWGHLIGGLVGGAAGGFMGKGDKSTPIQKKQKELIDQLMASLNGQGPYSNLFEASPEAFQKSFVDPAKKMFSNQIAPQIQQSYIANGQQRGTGMEDALTRAGVSMDDMLNQYYMNYMQKAQDRKLSGINNVLSQGAGAEAPISGMDSMLQGITGYAGSEDFGNALEGILSRRKGFSPNNELNINNNGTTGTGG